MPTFLGLVVRTFSRSISPRRMSSRTHSQVLLTLKKDKSKNKKKEKNEEEKNEEEKNEEEKNEKKKEEEEKEEEKKKK